MVTDPPETTPSPVRLRDGLVFVAVVFVAVRLAVSLTGVLTVDLLDPPAADPDGLVTAGIHNAFDGTDRWDARRYEAIAASGYREDDGSAAFFPGYPLAIRALDTVTPFGPFGAASVIANASYFAALLVLFALTAREYDVATARRTVLLLASFPASFFFLAPYSESLFLLLTLLTFWWIRSDRWGRGALASAGSAFVRSAGVLLVPALVVEAWELRGGDRRRAMVAAFAPVLGLLAYGAYWLLRSGDALQPLHAQSNWYRTFGWIPVTLWDAVRLGIEGVGDPRGIYWTVDLVLTGIVLGSIAWGWRALGRSYLVYALVTVVVILSYPLPERPLLSAPRFLIVVFPAFWAMASRIHGRMLWAVVGVFSVGFVVCASWFMNWGYLF